MGRLEAMRQQRRGAVLCVALVATLLGPTLAAAHDHVRAADYSQTCALCAVAHSPGQMAGLLEPPEKEPAVAIGSPVPALATPGAHRAFCSCLSRAPPA